VESVTTNPLIVQPPRERECLRHRGHTAMKGRVETGYLRQGGIKCECSSDRGETMRLVQRGKRDQSVQLDQQFPSHPFRPDVPRASMNYAMAKRSEPATAELVLRPRDQDGDYVARTRRRRCAEIGRFQCYPIGPGGRCGGASSDSVYLARYDPAVPFIERKFK
jgi:hypothetical protein